MGIASRSALHPAPGQERALLRLVAVCREVYNAALQERRDAYRTAGVTVTWQDQFNQIRHLRGVRDDALAFGIQPLRSAIMRCDAAMQAFFDRVKAGATPGYPPFKASRRFNTAAWEQPVSWKILDEGRTLRVQGVGADRGVKVTLATSDGRLLAMPRHVAAARDHIVALAQAQARKQKGSREWRRLGRHIARGRRRAAAQVDNWARDTASALVADYDIMAVEDLNLAAMTRSAKGTIAQPGTNVAQKQGLNRELQDAALGRLAVRICVKAESAGRRVWMVNPANTSRACSRCGHRPETHTACSSLIGAGSAPRQRPVRGAAQRGTPTPTVIPPRP